MVLDNDLLDLWLAGDARTRALVEELQEARGRVAALEWVEEERDDLLIEVDVLKEQLLQAEAARA